ncbi:hypothetical protein VTH82DRAFT_5681 [Thermothelomyces myriococcoides]
MRRPRFRRSPSSQYSDLEDVMPSIPESPTRTSLRQKDTGFPESFCGYRNTTLRHPDAIVGPDACITQDDVNPARGLLRYRMSYMAQLPSDSRASTFGNELSGGSSEEGPLSALGRLAVNSLRLSAEHHHLDALLPSKGVESSSDGMSGSDPDSLVHRGRVFSSPKTDAQEMMGKSRHKRRRSSFLSRLMHR